MSYRVSVDIGGTFADFGFFDVASKELFTLKVLTTPANPGQEVMEGFKVMSEKNQIDSSDVEYFTHGQTIGVNTVIQRVGGKLALFITENFSDVLELQRLRVPDAYNLFETRPEPLVSKDCVIPIKERTLADGSIKVPVDEKDVIAAIERAKSLGVEGVIISFLHSYKNPAHEIKVKEIIQRECPELFAFCSSEVAPVIREYERTVTTSINGYVHPKVSHYLSSLQNALKERGVEVEPLITKSNGGVMSAERGKTACVQTLLSGPAAGVIGAAFLGSMVGEKNIITMDMGGTSLDVSLIIDEKPKFSIGEYIGEFPLYIPAISVCSVGAGGGTIAWIDDFGVLKMGPRSAGSDPGPACYGKGGVEPTLTDAFAVCGFLKEANFAYGSVKLYPELAEKAVKKLADRLEMGLLETAEAIIKVSLSGMYLEMSKLIAKWGVDPREFTLLPFGGAGPMMACFLARELGIKRVMIPKVPGVLCAFGGLVADIKNDFMKTLYLDVSEKIIPDLKSNFDELKREALEWLSQEQQYSGKPMLHYSADMRYLGQAFEIEVPLEEDWVASGALDKFEASFNDQHELLYGYCDRKALTQIVNIRVVIVAATSKPETTKTAEAHDEAKPLFRQEIYSEEQMRKFAFFKREDLKTGHAFAGPAVILQDDSTTCVLAGFKARVDTFGNLILQSDI